jgi:hypothetical protein
MNTYPYKDPDLRSKMISMEKDMHKLKKGIKNRESYNENNDIIDNEINNNHNQYELEVDTSELKENTTNNKNHQIIKVKICYYNV